MIGTQLNHYKLIRRLGGGGTGDVYVAEDTTLDRQVALRVLPAELAADPERLASLEREAKAIAALDHPNIVTTYTIEQADDVRFITMQLVEGRTLEAIFRSAAAPAWLWEKSSKSVRPWSRRSALPMSAVSRTVI